MLADRAGVFSSLPHSLEVADSRGSSTSKVPSPWQSMKTRSQRLCQDCSHQPATARVSVSDLQFYVAQQAHRQHSTEGECGSTRHCRPSDLLLPGERALLELLQPGAGCRGSLLLPPSQRGEALGCKWEDRQPGLVWLVLLHHRLVLLSTRHQCKSSPEGESALELLS